MPTTSSSRPGSRAAGRHRAWQCCAAAVALIGVTLGVATIPAVTLVVVFVSGATVAVLRQLTSTMAEPAGEKSTSPPARMVPTALGSGMGTVAFLGMLVVLQGLGALLMLALAGCSPPVTTRLRTAWRRARRGSSPGREADPSLVVPPRPPPSGHDGLLTLTDEQLCRRWRSSFATLGRARDGYELQCASDHRAALLDELERRHPAGFRRWIDSGARAAGDPQRHLPRAHH